MNGFEMILPFLKPIEHLILDDTISEVMVNGSEHVFIEKDGFLQEIRGLSLGEKSLMIAVKNIARRLGDDISEAKPILDSRLPDGSRVAAVIPPCSLNGALGTLVSTSLRRQIQTDTLLRCLSMVRGSTKPAPAWRHCPVFESWTQKDFFSLFSFCRLPRYMRGVPTGFPLELGGRHQPR